jgi:CCR4-NOT transcription complex subunit 7/8
MAIQLQLRSQVCVALVSMYREQCRSDVPPLVSIKSSCAMTDVFLFPSSRDMYAPESIDLLQKAGIDFGKHLEFGIMPNHFAELMITSGLVLTDDTKWISFHSGYDFGYFVKLLTSITLPASEDDFFDVLKLWFPSVYDIKVMVRVFRDSSRGGLQDIADELGVSRVGTSHQAGSDSLLTASTFFKMKQAYFHDTVAEEYRGMIYGLGQSFTALNGITTDPIRVSVMTVAEREDRTSTRELSRTQTPGPVGAGGASQQPNGSLNMTSMGVNSLQSSLQSGGYDAMQPPYMRTAMVGGR